MTLSRLYSVISGRRLAFLLTLGCVVSLVGLGTMLSRPQYRAEAQVFVHPRGLSDLQSIIANHLSNEADLIRSARVSIAALGLLGMQRDAELSSRWRHETGGRGDFESWAAEQLSRRLDVKPARDSNILAIAYLAPDPATAARTANAFLNAYLQTSSQIREEGATQLATAFAGGTKELKATLDAAEERLASFQRENGVVSVDEKLDGDTLRLSELSAQLVAAQGAAVTAAGRQKQALSNGSATQEVLKDPLVSSLQSELARQEARLDELRLKLGNEHPTLVEQQGQVNALRTRVGAATARASSSTGAESRIAAGSVASIQSALEAQRARVLAIKPKRDEALRLQREAELARKAYDAAVIRMNETVWDSGASHGRVSVVKAASVPAKPDFPRPMVNFFASMVMGVIAGVAAAFWRESRDRRVRLDDDVAGLLKQPLVAVLSNGRAAAPRLRLSRS